MLNDNFLPRPPEPGMVCPQSLAHTHRKVIWQNQTKSIANIGGLFVWCQHCAKWLWFQCSEDTMSSLPGDGDAANSKTRTGIVRLWHLPMLFITESMNTEWITAIPRRPLNSSMVCTPHLWAPMKVDDIGFSIHPKKLDRYVGTRCQELDENYPKYYRKESCQPAGPCPATNIIAGSSWCRALTVITSSGSQGDRETPSEPCYSGLNSNNLPMASLGQGQPHWCAPHK